MVFVAYELVVSRGMVLVVIISNIDCSWYLKKTELPLGASVVYLVEAHVESLGPLLLQDFVGKCIIFGSVHLYYCWGLWVSHL